MSGVYSVATTTEVVDFVRERYDVQASWWSANKALTNAALETGRGYSSWGITVWDIPFALGVFGVTGDKSNDDLVREFWWHRSNSGSYTHRSFTYVCTINFVAARYKVSKHKVNRLIRLFGGSVRQVGQRSAWIVDLSEVPPLYSFPLAFLIADELRKEKLNG